MCIRSTGLPPETHMQAESGAGLLRARLARASIATVDSESTNRCLAEWITWISREELPP